MITIKYITPSSEKVLETFEDDKEKDALDFCVHYLEDYTDYDEDDGDTLEEVKAILLERGFYIIGYGPAELIFEKS